MSLKDKTIVVTGGSRGLGLGLVEALVDAGRQGDRRGARHRMRSQASEQRLGVAVAPADVTDEAAAQRILAEVRPDILVLNAGATPPMGRLDQLSWADFTAPWETDVKAGLYWIQAALNLPLEPGSRVLVGSSGAAENGSPLSGGYAGAKRMLWFMAKYANGVARQKGLGIRFQAIVPQQIIGGTGVGDDAAHAYAQAAGSRPRGVPGALRRAAAAARVRRPSGLAAGRSAICNRRRLRPQGRYGHHGPGGRRRLSGGLSSPPTARHAELLALAGELRPELHRYCARLMGSVIDGEDVGAGHLRPRLRRPGRTGGGPAAPPLAVPDRP